MSEERTPWRANLPAKHAFDKQGEYSTSSIELALLYIKDGRDTDFAYDFLDAAWYLGYEVDLKSVLPQEVNGMWVHYYKKGLGLDDKDWISYVAISALVTNTLESATQCGYTLSRCWDNSWYAYISWPGCNTPLHVPLVGMMRACEAAAK